MHTFQINFVVVVVERQGADLGDLGVIFEPLGAILEPSWSILGGLGSLLGRPCSHLERSWTLLDASRSELQKMLMCR